ncbi:hypothetical protein GCM10027048_06310 [Hymenobacter coalescens]
MKHSVSLRFRQAAHQYRSVVQVSCVALLTLGVHAAASAAPGVPAPQPPVSVQAIDHESVRVRIANPAQQTSRVQVVRLSSGQVLFDEAHADVAYGHRFNFRHLPAGRYSLLMTVGPQQYRYTMEVQSGGSTPAVAIRSIKVRLPKATAATAAL